MSDQDQDQSAAGATGDHQLGAWPEPAQQPGWSDIEAEAAPAGPGSAEPGPAPKLGATESGRSRRPSSLRSAAEASGVTPRRRLAPPQAPSASATAASQPDQQSPVSEPAPAGKSGHMPNPGPVLAEKLPVEKLRTLVRERPEVGLGLAFAGGLVIAAIVRRLAR